MTQFSQTLEYMKKGGQVGNKSNRKYYWKKKRLETLSYEQYKTILILSEAQEIKTDVYN
jgi:hypothetical protein